VGVSGDKDPDFTDEFCGFLQRCVSNVDAAELLLLFFTHPHRSWRRDDLTAQLAAMVSLSETDAERYLGVFESEGLIERDADRLARFRPAASDHAHVATLARLYVERPVTLFRVIYALRDSKIRTFADAFNLRR
jgi:hypothetical protein